jgi:hypothetical protein
MSREFADDKIFLAARKWRTAQDNKIERSNPNLREKISLFSNIKGLAFPAPSEARIMPPSPS